MDIFQLKLMTRENTETLSKRLMQQVRKTLNVALYSENIGLVVQLPCMLSLSGKAAWIIDSGATSYMCNDHFLFVEYESLKTPLKVTLGDGYEVDAI